MATSFLYKLFLSTIGTMPPQYDPEVDSWWGIILTELGLLDPFREENMSYFFMKFRLVCLFALFLGALSLCNAYKKIRKERDDAREDSTKGVYEYCDLNNKLRDAENELYYANERQQDANDDMNEERKEFRNTIEDLNEQRLVDQEEIRSLKQHVSNTECDREEYGRKLVYASRTTMTMEREKQKLECENQRLEASLTEKDNEINDLQTQMNSTTLRAVAAASSAPKYIQLNNETEMHQVHQTGITIPSSRDTAPEQAAADGGLADRDERFRDLEQRNGILSSELELLRTDLENLRGGHGECSVHLQTQLAEKEEEASALRTEKASAEKDLTETVAALRGELLQKEQQVGEVNGALTAYRASSADNVQRLKTLKSELEASRQAHARCDKDSASQSSRIDELVASKEQLDDTLRLKDDEIVNLQGRVSDSQKNLEELQKTHATCKEHASSQVSQLTQLQGAHGLLRASNDDLSQQLERAQIERADLIREGQRVEQNNQALLNLRTCSQSETSSLQARIRILAQEVDNQQQHIRNLETNCPRCRDLRVALDAVVVDVKMSDDESRAELKREITEELRSQVPDDLRRQLRGEVERSLREEFRKHYSDLCARNSNRIQEQDRLIKNKDAELEKAKANRTICEDHAACEKKEGNLMASITKLEQNAKILQGNCSRLKSSAQNDREQLGSARTANDDLRRELESIKGNQQRAMNTNPLQSKLAACQRESERMKVDRDKARNNCSIYSKNLSDLRKQYEALQIERLVPRERSILDGDSLMEDGCNDRRLAVQNERTITRLQNEVSRLSKELEHWRARGDIQDQATEIPSAVLSDQALPVDEGEQQWPEGSFPDNQSSKAPAADRDEATALELLRHEVDLREARDGKKAVYVTGLAEGNLDQRSAQDSDDEADDEADDEVSLPINEGGQSDDELEEGEILDTPRSAPHPPPRFGLQPECLLGCQSTNKPLVGRGEAGKKRGPDEFLSGEVDDEGFDEFKKLKIHHPQALWDSSRPGGG